MRVKIAASTSCFLRLLLLLLLLLLDFDVAEVEEPPPPFSPLEDVDEAVVEAAVVVAAAALLGAVDTCTRRHTQTRISYETVYTILLDAATYLNWCFLINKRDQINLGSLHLG